MIDLLKYSVNKQKEIKKLPFMPFGKAKDLTGEQYGLLTILGRDSSCTSHVKVWCICNCKEQNIVSVYKDNLITGKVSSCGCKRKETAAKHATELNQARKLDLTNKVFGFLQVIEEDTKKSQEKNRYYWKCKCLQCNRPDLYSVRTDSLTSGLTSVCDVCSQQMSMGEYFIIKILNDNNITYVKEKRFDDCRFPDTDSQAKFDFYLPDKNYIIEFDGEQHYRSSTWYPAQEYIQQHDEYKNNWCKQNNIPLIRIPYWKRKSLELKDLQIETTTYRIV